MVNVRRPKPLQRWLPVGQLLVAFVIAVLILPSALRPPPDQATTSAEFSPDAPPDQKKTDAIFSALKRAESSGVQSEVAVEAPTTTIPVKRKPPKGQCFGDPPQQIESVYSPPCQPGFQGDNGGDTARGVSRDEIRVGFIMELTGSVGYQNRGAVPTEPTPGEGANLRTYRVLQAYFNQRYEFYGRQVRFYYVAGNPAQTTATDDEDERARATQAVNEYKVFAAIHETNPASLEELVRNHVVTYSLAQVPRVFYSERRPYMWSFTPDATTLVDMGAEYICKRLAGKPAKYTTDPALDLTKRKYGILAYDLPAYKDNSPRMQRLLQEQCGIKIEPGADVRYTLEQGRAADLGAAVSKLAAARVTTVIYLGDLISAAIFTQEAQNQQYSPEWFLPGFGGVDTGDTPRAYVQAQWAHAFGFSVYEVPRPRAASECFRAYHSIDPANDPDTNMCRYMWGHMVQLLGAIQETGPNLTPERFEQGQFRIPPTKPYPTWRIAGGYGPTDYTYPDYAAEIWWDPTATWGEDGGPGAYRWIDGGKRYRLGEWPADPNGQSQVHVSGVSRAPD
jgi:hypothetical protein